MMIAKIWLILMLCTFASNKENADYTLTVNDEGVETVYEVTSLGHGVWNIDMPHPEKPGKMFPINFKITPEGEFRTLLDEVSLRTDQFFKLADGMDDWSEGIDWDNKNEVKYVPTTHPEESKISLKRKGNKMTISQSEGYIGEAKSIVLEWKEEQ